MTVIFKHLWNLYKILMCSYIKLCYEMPPVMSDNVCQGLSQRANFALANRANIHSIVGGELETTYLAHAYRPTIQIVEVRIKEKTFWRTHFHSGFFKCILC